MMMMMMMMMVMMMMMMLFILHATFSPAGNVENKRRIEEKITNPNLFSHKRRAGDESVLHLDAFGRCSQLDCEVSMSMLKQNMCKSLLFQEKRFKIYMKYEGTSKLLRP